MERWAGAKFPMSSPSPFAPKLTCGSLRCEALSQFGEGPSRLGNAAESSLRCVHPIADHDVAGYVNPLTAPLVIPRANRTGHELRNARSKRRRRQHAGGPL